MKFPAIIRPLSQVARPPRKFGAGSDANVPGVRNRLTTSAIAFNEARNWCFLRAFRVSGRLTGNYYLSSSWPGRLPNGNFRVAGNPTGTAASPQGNLPKCRFPVTNPLLSERFGDFASTDSTDRLSRHAHKLFVVIANAIFYSSRRRSRRRVATCLRKRRVQDDESTEVADKDGVEQRGGE